MANKNEYRGVSLDLRDVAEGVTELRVLHGNETNEPLAVLNDPFGLVITEHGSIDFRPSVMTWVQSVVEGCIPSTKGDQEMTKFLIVQVMALLPDSKALVL